MDRCWNHMKQSPYKKLNASCASKKGKFNKAGISQSKLQINQQNAIRKYCCILPKKNHDSSEFGIKLYDHQYSICFQYINGPTIKFFLVKCKFFSSLATIVQSALNIVHVIAFSAYVWISYLLFFLPCFPQTCFFEYGHNRWAFGFSQCSVLVFHLLVTLIHLSDKPCKGFMTNIIHPVSKTYKKNKVSSREIIFCSTFLRSSLCPNQHSCLFPNQ